MTGVRAVDLRSDTRTLPDGPMRAAMAQADVGDDSFGDDPSVLALEEKTAKLTAKAAAVFTCGGTMSNLLGVLSLAGIDQAATVIAGMQSHIVHYENDGVRTLGRATLLTVPDAPHGELDAAALSAALTRRRRGPAVVCLENTSNRLGGIALDVDATGRQIAVAREAGAAVHLDGARLPNASVALGRTIAELAAGADTVAISLCKGLGAPAGSVLCGAADVIERARYLRRMVGGTMHQSGVLAAAGLLALSRMGRLADDHRRAAMLATGLRGIRGLAVSEVPRPTNMVLAGVRGIPAQALADCLAGHGVLGLAVNHDEVRFVAHAGHDDHDIDLAIRRCSQAVAEVCTALARDGHEDEHRNADRLRDERIHRPA